jgi:uncharacterized protein
MFTIKFDDIPDEGLQLEWAEDQASLSAYLEDFSQIDFDFESPLQSEASIRKSGRSVLIRGKLSTSLRLRCVRCLKEFSCPLSSTFEAALLASKEADVKEAVELETPDLESGFYDGEEIRISEIACEQIFLEIPYQPLCDEKCKGLCPVCGKDLNLSACECVREEFSSGFSVLQDLKLDR